MLLRQDFQTKKARHTTITDGKLIASSQTNGTTAPCTATRPCCRQRSHTSQSLLHIYRSCFWPTFSSLFVDLPAEMWLCGLKILRGQSIWLLRLEALCRPITGNELPSLDCVCYRRSNGPHGNLLVPTLSIRGLIDYLSQSSKADQLQGLSCALNGSKISGTPPECSHPKLTEQLER